MNDTGFWKQLIQLAINRPVGVVMIFTSLVVLGYLSYEKIEMSLLPEITYPRITIKTEYGEESPLEVEENVTKPIEEAVGVVSGVIDMNSISRKGVSLVVLDFEWGSNLNSAVNEIREKIDMVKLPDDVKHPLIMRYDPSSEPVMRIGIYGEKDFFTLRKIAEFDIKPILDTIEGVASVKVYGGYEEEIKINLNNTALEVLNLKVDDVIQRLSRENMNIASGNIIEGGVEYLVRALNEFKSVSEIEEVVVAIKEDGGIVKLKDIATVELSHKDLTTLTRINGKDSVEIDIFKDSDANIIEVCKRLTERIYGKQEIKGQSPGRSQVFRKDIVLPIVDILPEGVSIKIISDSSRFIKTALNEVKNNAIYGGVFAISVLYFFLRNFFYTTLIGLSIPISLIITFCFMYAFNVKFNLISLGGIALGVGMLVDNAIVVLESIFRCREEGDDVQSAVRRGVFEVANAVTASTLTTIVVFAPVAFVEGIAGQIFKDLALVVIFSLFASLLVSLFFIPMICALYLNFSTKISTKIKIPDVTPFTKFAVLKKISEFYNSSKRKRFILMLIPFFILQIVVIFLFELIGKILGLTSVSTIFVFRSISSPVHLALRLLFIPINSVFRYIVSWVILFYKNILKSAIKLKILICICAVGLLAISFFFFTKIGKEVMPEIYQGEFNVELSLSPGTSIKNTEEVVKNVEKKIKDNPFIEHYSALIGVEEDMIRTFEGGEHTARMTIQLKSSEDMKQTEKKVVDFIIESFKDEYIKEVKITHPSFLTFKSAIEINVMAEDLYLIKKVAEEVVDVLKKIEDVENVRYESGGSNPEIVIEFDREKLSKYEIDVGRAAEVIRNKIKGAEPTKFTRGTRKIPMLVRLEEKQRNTIQDLINLKIEGLNGNSIQLGSVANFKEREGTSQIRRSARQRTNVISADFAGFNFEKTLNSIEQNLKSVRKPQGVNIVVAGQSAEMKRSVASFQIAMALAIFLVYTVIACQFENFLQPLLIMFSVPFAFAGTFFAFFFFNKSLNVVVLLGLIILTGIVVNNSIVLIDYVNRLRKRMDKRQAVIEGASLRLRPILMTALTTLIGLIPMALWKGEAAEIRNDLGITVITGLASSVVLTLIIIPVFYDLLTKEN